MDTDEENIPADKAEIRRALGYLAEPDSVVELRCPKQKGKKGVISGYFDDLERLAKAASYWSGRAEAVYVTLNPVLPDLLARSYNCAAPCEHATGDDEVLRRRWFFVDFDPVRPAGVSSNTKEHASAIQRATDCRGWLRESGWPEPMLADSGNGAHLLYRIDLPNSPAALLAVKNALAALAARFDDAVVKVDPTTFNASRVSKLYGTLAAKGSSVPKIDRVYRLARILEVPAEFEIVPFTEEAP